MTTHAVQSTESSRLVSVARLRRADEDVEAPRDQSTSNCKDEDAIKNLLHPFNDRARSKEEKYDGGLHEWENRDVEKIESEENLERSEAILDTRARTRTW